MVCTIKLKWSFYLNFLRPTWNLDLVTSNMTSRWPHWCPPNPLVSLAAFGRGVDRCLPEEQGDHIEVHHFKFCRNLNWCWTYLNVGNGEWFTHIYNKNEESSQQPPFPTKHHEVCWNDPHNFDPSLQRFLWESPGAATRSPRIFGSSFTKRPTATFSSFPSLCLLASRFTFGMFHIPQSRSSWPAVISCHIPIFSCWIWLEVPPIFQGNYTPLFHGFIRFYSTFLALLIMMTASAVIAALDDKRRHEADVHTNNQSPGFSLQNLLKKLDFFGGISGVTFGVQVSCFLHGNCESVGIICFITALHVIV